jgi:membrane protein DedA with SNARE-associated domain
LLPPERSARIEALYQRRGGWIVFLARHVAGLRAATFVMAGVHRMRPRTFIAWDGLAACVSVPLMVGLGYAGALHLDRVRADIALVERYVLLAIGIGVLGWLLLRRSRRSRVSNGASVSKRNASAVVR